MRCCSCSSSTSAAYSPEGRVCIAACDGRLLHGACWGHVMLEACYMRQFPVDSVCVFAYLSCRLRRILTHTKHRIKRRARKHVYVIRPLALSSLSSLSPSLALALCPASSFPPAYNPSLLLMWHVEGILWAPPLNLSFDDKAAKWSTPPPPSKL